MESQENIFFSLEIIKTVGVFPKVNKPNLICSIRAFHLPNHFNDANLSIVQRISHNEWKEYQKNLTQQESQNIVEFFRKLGIPNRLPKIDGFLDETADLRTDLLIHIYFEEKHFYLNINSVNGDFLGDDAQTLEELFQYIFRLVELENTIGKYVKPVDSTPANDLILDNIMQPLNYNVSNIQLTQTNPALYFAYIEDSFLLENAEFYLIAETQNLKPQLAENFIRLVKISSKEIINVIVDVCLPGIVITSVNLPEWYSNNTDSPNPTKEVFQLDTIGAYWDGIKGTKSIAVYVPEEVSVSKLELYAVVNQINQE